MLSSYGALLLKSIGGGTSSIQCQLLASAYDI